MTGRWSTGRWPTGARGTVVAAALLLTLASPACGGKTSSPTGTARAVTATRSPSATPGTRTATAATPTRPPATSARDASRPATAPPAPTPPSPPNGSPVIITVTPTGRLTAADLSARGIGTPGRGPFNGESVIVPVQDLELPLVALVVGSDGAMPPAPFSDTAAWYDFSMWPGLGGLPGAGGNVVLAVRNGRIRVGAGDYLNLRLKNGSTVCYRVAWTKIDEGFAGDYDALVTATADEFVTLIGAGPTQDQRMITSARRADCAAQPAATPTPTPRAGHQELHIVARGSQFTLIEGNTIPVPIHTIDLLFDNLDQGVAHHIVFYDPQSAVYFDAGEVQGRTVGWRAQIPAGPRTGSTQHYTFRCIIHPSMTGDLFVE